MTYDPNWKQKLEAKRAARGEKGPAAPAKTSVGQGCLRACLVGFLALVVLASLPDKPKPAPVDPAAVAKAQAEARRQAELDRAKREEGRIKREQELEMAREAQQKLILEQIEKERQWLDISDLTAEVQNQLTWEKKWVGVKGRVVGNLVKSSREFGGTAFVILRDEQGRDVKVLLEKRALLEWAAGKSIGSRVVMQVEVKGLSPVGYVVNLIGIDAELP